MNQFVSKNLYTVDMVFFVTLDALEKEAKGKKIIRFRLYYMIDNSVNLFVAVYSTNNIKGWFIDLVSI